MKMKNNSSVRRILVLMMAVTLPAWSKRVQNPKQEIEAERYSDSLFATNEFLMLRKKMKLLEDELKELRNENDFLNNENDFLTMMILDYLESGQENEVVGQSASASVTATNTSEDRSYDGAAPSASAGRELLRLGRTRLRPKKETSTEYKRQYPQFENRRGVICRDAGRTLNDCINDAVDAGNSLNRWNTEQCKNCINRMGACGCQDGFAECGEQACFSGFSCIEDNECRQGCDCLFGLDY